MPSCHPPCRRHPDESRQPVCGAGDGGARRAKRGSEPVFKSIMPPTTKPRRWRLLGPGFRLAFAGMTAEGWEVRTQFRDLEGQAVNGDWWRATLAIG